MLFADGGSRQLQALGSLRETASFDRLDKATMPLNRSRMRSDWFL